jgi:hypothetical protein
MMDLVLRLNNFYEKRLSCQCSQTKPIACQSLQLGTPKMMMQNVLHKRLKLHTYKI